jgi:predicted RNase H-like HicB family nuclease
MSKEKVVYPVIITKIDDYYSVRVPAFSSTTEGDDMADAIAMARDLISLMSIDFEDKGKELPKAEEIKEVPENSVVTWVDADLLDYRRKYDKRTVKKNCTLPSYLSYEAEKQGINFSKVLQDALIEKLGISTT